MTDEQRGGQQPAGVAAARMQGAGRWVLGHGVEEALVLVPATGAVVLPMWWLQLPAAAAAAVAAGLWARHELRTHRRVRRGAQHRVTPPPSSAAITPADDSDQDDAETDDGPRPGQREVSTHG